MRPLRSAAGGRGLRRLLGTLVLGSLMSLAGAEDIPAPLPDPLTLEYALTLADAAHPQLEQARAGVDLAEAERAAAEARYGINASVDARARWIEPSSSTTDNDHNDSAAVLSLRKRLYDFGRTSAAVDAADLELEGSRWRLAGALGERQLTIMQRYFDVLLADLTYARDNEAMAITYVRLERVQDRNQLGQASDVELRAQEARYRAALLKRTRSEAQQRSARARLAAALNRPGELSANLQTPELDGMDRPLPDLDALQALAERHNPVLRSLRARREAGYQRLMAARAERRPILEGEVEAGRYARELSSREDFGAGVTLEIPLYSGGRVAAEVARRRAELRALQAEQDEARLEVRQAVLDTWQELQTLQTQREEVRTLLAYRDLDLDRRRALYELEVSADLGDAMADFTAARLREAQTTYATALARARLRALTGDPPWPPPDGAPPTTPVPPPKPKP